MLRTIMKSKIHRAVVTHADVAYQGSITLDRDLMDAADLVEFERVQVVNVNNGARFETYVIEGERYSGTVCLNGAAARLVLPGDPVIVISYAGYAPEELAEFEPTVVFVDERNRPLAPAQAGPGADSRSDASADYSMSLIVDSTNPRVAAAGPSGVRSARSPTPTT